MTEQSENKAETTATDKPTQPAAAPTKPAKEELSEQELEKASGGTINWGDGSKKT